jgi:hypothetical protein
MHSWLSWHECGIPAVIEKRNYPTKCQVYSRINTVDQHRRFNVVYLKFPDLYNLYLEEVFSTCYFNFRQFVGYCAENLSFIEVINTIVWYGKHVLIPFHTFAIWTPSNLLFQNGSQKSLGIASPCYVAGLNERTFFSWNVTTLTWNENSHKGIRDFNMKRCHCGYYVQ